MKKKRMIMKILKKGMIYMKILKKGGGSREKGGGGNEIHAPCACDIASCYRFSCYYRFSDIAINSVNPSFIWRLEFSKNG